MLGNTIKILSMGTFQDIKAFYMRRNNDGKTVAAMDMLVPRVISGFSIRFYCLMFDSCSDLLYPHVHILSVHLSQ